MKIDRNFIRRTPVTCVLIAINVLIMGFMAFENLSGETNSIMATWAAYTPAIITEKEYYRLFTPMFLHFGIEHLFNNMLLLLFLGEIIEEKVGAVRYLAIYLLGGVLGNVLSMALDLRLPDSQMPISAGASGAVFALIGAMAYLLLINKGRLAGVTLTRLMILIVLSAWDGFRNTNIDGAAHIGGLIAGFLLTALLTRRENENNVYNGWQG